jgi:hypothetical protein
MDAQNEITININDVPIANPVPEGIPVTLGQLLDADFSNDDEAEFLQAVLDIQQDIYNVWVSDEPEKFLIPDETGVSPIMTFLEKLEELKSFTFGDRTLARMERRIRGENLVVEKLTQLEKSEHPDYKDWCCHKCLDYFKGNKELKKHMLRNICKERHNRLFVKATKDKVPTPTFFHTTAAMDSLFGRAVEYKKNVEPELVEEEIEEDLHIVSITAEEQVANDATANVYVEPEVRYKLRCVYQEGDGDPYEDDLVWNNKEYYDDVDDAKTDLIDAWTYWSADAGGDLKMIELIAYEINGIEMGDEWVVDSYDIETVCDPVLECKK